MLKVVILRGIPASGKSTWAKQKVKEGQGKWKRINKDDLRAMIDCGEWSKERENLIVQVRNKLLVDFLKDGFSVIIDDTNLAGKHITDITNIVNKFNSRMYADYGETKQAVQVEIKWFPVSLEDAVRRDSEREAKVGVDVIRRMYKQYVEAGGPPPTNTLTEKLDYIFDKAFHKQEGFYSQDTSLPKVIVCDLDGTLALFDGKRSPYDASKCADDDLNEPVANVLRCMFRCGYKLILVSGREDKFYQQTQEFLDKHQIHFTALLMRKTGDFRKDSIVKREIYDQFIKGRYYVECWLDDRNQVVDMVRKELHLPCFQVNYGNF